MSTLSATAGADSTLMRPESEFAYGRVGTKALCARGTPLWAPKGEGGDALAGDSEADDVCNREQRHDVLLCSMHSMQHKLVSVSFAAVALDVK